MTVQDEYIAQVLKHAKEFSRHIDWVIFRSQEDEWDGIRRLVKRVEAETKEPAR